MVKTEALQPQAIDVAITAALNNISGQFSLELEQRLSLEQFIQRNDVFELLPVALH